MGRAFVRKYVDIPAELQEELEKLAKQLNRPQTSIIRDAIEKEIKALSTPQKKGK